MVGARRLKRERFFSAHPWCCFCGGDTASTTEDHIPARGLFLDRLWPEGYVFPACEMCNNSTSKDEFLLAWLVRVRFDGAPDAAHEDFARATRELKRIAPDVWATLRLHSRAETRRLLKRAGMPSSLPGLDVVHTVVVPPAILAAADRYAEKLAKALHYFHSGRIVPKTAIVKTRVLLNAETVSTNHADQFLRIVNGTPQIKRAQSSLEGQFDYRYVTVEGGEASAFVVSFGDSTVMLLMIFFDAARYEESKARRALDRANGGVASSDPLSGL